jgi:hypothetical protein
MNRVCNEAQPDFVRGFLYFKEVTMLANVKEALVRKDIEQNGRS